jgi:hypothetical protein
LAIVLVLFAYRSGFDLVSPSYVLPPVLVDLAMVLVLFCYRSWFGLATFQVWFGYGHGLVWLTGPGLGLLHSRFGSEIILV